MQTFQKLNTLIHELGAFNAALYLLDRALKRTGLSCRCFRYYFVSQPVQPPMLPERWRKKVVVRRFCSFDGCMRSLPLTHDVLEYRFDQGAQCFCAFVGDSPVGCLWIILGGYNEDEVRARFVPVPSEKAGWDFDVYISPDQRGKLVFPRLWDEANAWLAQQGKSWSLSRISAFNPASIHGHKRLGARSVGSSTFLRFGPIQLCFSSLKPRMHISLTASTRPLFRIPAQDHAERSHQ